MKTLKEIKNEIAIEKAYDSWNEITFFNNRNVVFIELLMDEVAKKMPELISKYKAVVVKGHGVFAAGKTLEEACMYLSVTENASKIIYMLGLK